jgi:hypothetical protein
VRAYFPPRTYRGASPGVRWRVKVAPGLRGALRTGLIRSLLAILVVGLCCLGSYDLQSSKPRSPNRPVERICSGRLTLGRAASDGQIPLCQSVASLAQPDPAIQRAIIVIQGSGRNAPSSYDAVLDVVRDAERHDTLVLAPQFLTALDLGTREPRPDVAYWRSGAWSEGERSDRSSPGEHLSSFEVLDRLIEELAVPGHYPNLNQITIAGHSAGGQFVQRYAAGTRIEQHHSIDGRPIAFRYIAANPSSYLYLFPRQPDRTTQACPRYDEYKYGLRDLNPYLQPLGPDGIRDNYARKDVTILLGQMDHQMLDPSKDDTCPAVAQGANRLSRGLRFAQFLTATYGAGVHHTHAVVVPGVGHNARGMFTSPAGRAALLRD